MKRTLSPDGRAKHAARMRGYRRAASSGDKLTECGRQWRRANRKKYLCTRAVQYAIARGTLVRQECEVCAEVRTHAHHDDYDHPLTVRWLCALHHARWHSENGEGKNAHTPIATKPKHSQFRGVWRRPSGAYVAAIESRSGNRRKTVSSEIEAAHLYDTWALELHGPRAKLNFPKTEAA